MTERLFYQDAYQRAFTARVTARRALAGSPAVALTQTAFYPTGGGQPCDTGTLTGPDGTRAAVVDVVSEDASIWHLLDRPLAGDDLAGQIAWPRRLDHMQQHTGQHVLSQAFSQAFEAETVAFHLGAAASTIDLNRIDLRPEDLAAVEAHANAIVDAALPVTAGFVTPDELTRLPLRKPPKVTENVRIVQVAGFDWSACGGTHVANTSQIGLIKITGVERRGPELRVTFLCGGRARGDYARLKALAQSLVARFTTAEDELPQAVDRRAAELDALRKDIAGLETSWADSTAAALWAAAAPCGGWRLVMATLEGEVERAKKVAQALRGRAGGVILLGVRGERPQLIFTRSDDVALDMAGLLRVAVTGVGGRGGGRPDWAQGGVTAASDLAAVLAAAQAAACPSGPFAGQR